MGRFGFGTRGAGSRRKPGSSKPGAIVPQVAPSAVWTGVAGSGFASIPADPVRTTAKPVCRLITPPFQWFTDTLLVGVVAGANDDGSLLDNMGLEKVIVHYEGNSVDILVPTFQTFDDANGSPATYFGWWANLEHNGTHGNARVFFEAVPRDSALQNRVIGPFQFSPKAAKYTHQIEIAATPAEIAGQRYKTLANAIGYLRGRTGPINPLLTFTEGGTLAFDGHPFGYNLSNHVDGYINITATMPVTFQNTTGFTTFAAVANGMHLIGQNITFDFKTASTVTYAGWPGHGHWFDGCRLINSNGSYDLVRKRTRNETSQLITGQSEVSKAYITECYFEAVWNIAQSTKLVRGCTVHDCWGDLFNNTPAVIGNTVSDWTFKTYRTPLDAMRVTYTGAQATATIEISLGNGYNNRVITARWGSNSATFTLKNDSAGFAAGTNYHVSNIVDWINTTLAGADAGWSATLLDDTRWGVGIVASDTDLVSSYPQTSVKGTALTLRTAFDVHGDWWQQQNTAGVAEENSYIANNRAWGCEGQILLWGGDAGMRDTICINNAWSMRDNANSPNQFSQFGRAASHVVIAHNSMVNQGVWMRLDQGANSYNPDAYSLTANNVFRTLQWLTSSDADLSIKDNHLNAGATDPAHATGTTIGGTYTTLFTDALAGNFAPAGDLLTNLKTPVVKYDLNRTRRGPRAAVGAVN